MSSDDDHLMGDNDDNAMMVAPEGEEGDLGYNGVSQQRRRVKDKRGSNKSSFSAT